MKRLIAALVLASAAGLSACEEPRRDEGVETAPAVEPPPAPAVEDVAAPAAATAPETSPATDPSTLPPEKRTSEETVQPESETLFY